MRDFFCLTPLAFTNAALGSGLSRRLRGSTPAQPGNPGTVLGGSGGLSKYVNTRLVDCCKLCACEVSLALKKI